MKITEESINHNLAQIIEDMVGVPFKYADQEDYADHQRLVTLGCVKGAMDLANRLKAVLKC